MKTQSIITMTQDYSEEIKQSYDLSRWLKRDIEFDGISDEMLMSALVNSLNQQGFKIIETITSDDSIKLTAIYGSKIKVLLLKILFILFFVRLHPITRHLPWGKRFVIDASIMKTKPIRLNIKITPYMEFIDAEEIPVGTQKHSEKFSDEYLAAVKLHNIVVSVYSQLGLLLPGKDVIFNHKDFMSDTALELIIYPLDSYDASKTIYVPVKPGPSWSWKAFGYGEFWFLWNEIWGIFLLSILLVYVFFELTDKWPENDYVWLASIVFFVLYRIALGSFGPKIYFLRYGKWPN